VGLSLRSIKARKQELLLAEALKEACTSTSNSSFVVFPSAFEETTSCFASQFASVFADCESSSGFSGFHASTFGVFSCSFAGAVVNTANFFALSFCFAASSFALSFCFAFFAFASFEASFFATTAAFFADLLFLATDFFLCAFCFAASSHVVAVCFTSADLRTEFFEDVHRVVFALFVFFDAVSAFFVKLLAFSVLCGSTGNESGESEQQSCAENQKLLHG
tara:strand:+ start:13525 stop:14187 length:663 start_codon:yes stop_codon:yes gene_type:complete